MAEKILVVDDDPNILDAFKRTLRKQFKIDTAPGGKEGLQAVAEKGPYAVVVSDQMMPGMDGIQFLTEVRYQDPDAVRVMLTGHPDLQIAIDAVNEGHLFRFLTKPISPDVMTKIIRTCAAQHMLITAEKELLEKTLSGSVNVLMEILSMVNPTAFGRTLRIKKCVMHIVNELKLPHAWQFGLASMLSQIGCVTLPIDTLNKVYAGMLLSKTEHEMYSAQPTVGRNLLANIPRLGTVARMIEAQQQPFTRRSKGDDFKGEDLVALGGHLLKVALDFDLLLMQGISPKSALAVLQQQSDDYDQDVVKTLETLDLEPAGRIAKSLRVRELNTSMTLDQDVHSKTGILLGTKGQEISFAIMHRLRAYAKSVGVEEPFRVIVQRAGIK